jgi:hypothetical protein
MVNVFSAAEGACVINNPGDVSKSDGTLVVVIDSLHPTVVFKICFVHLRVCLIVRIS